MKNNEQAHDSCHDDQEQFIIMFRKQKYNVAYTLNAGQWPDNYN